jgi:hypothetical protein
MEAYFNNFNAGRFALSLGTLLHVSAMGDMFSGLAYKKGVNEHGLREF